MGYSIGIRIPSAKRRLAVLKVLQAAWDDINARMPKNWRESSARPEVDALSNELGMSAFETEFESPLSVMQMLFAYPRAGANSRGNPGLSYDHHPEAIGFDYGNHGLAWAGARYLAARYKSAIYYDGELQEDPGEPSADTTAWLSWLGPWLDAKLSKAGL